MTLGMLDWGIGGLSVLRGLQAMGVQAHVIYASDAASAPYGTLSAAALAAQVRRVCERLTGLGASQIVVACNAASTALPLPGRVDTLGVIQAGIAEVQARGLRSVAVLGGARTISSRAYSQGLPGVHVTEHVAQPLSALVEAGQLHGPHVRAAVAQVLRGVGQVEGLVLACTHYPALRHHFLALRPELQLLDPGQATAAHVAAALPPGALRVRYLSSGDPAAMRSAALAAFGVHIDRVEPLW